MVFNENKAKTAKKPVCKGITYWFFIYASFLISFSGSVFSISKHKVDTLSKDLSLNFFGIIYDSKKNTYATISVVPGKTSELYQFDQVPIMLTEYTNNNITFSLSTYEEFYKIIQPIIVDIKLFNKLPQGLNKYFSLLGIEPFELQINVVFLLDEKRIFHISDKQPADGVINLNFYSSVNQEQIDNFSKYIEEYSLGTFPHEVFHFLAKYSNLGKMNELREEVYASLFGQCIAYEISSELFFPLDIMEVPSGSFEESKKPIKKIKKAFKKALKKRKQKAFKSRTANVIAQAYFRAVANNIADRRFSSTKIPKFCHKLFSERNFKHPIEKKPPPWFKEFLEANR